MKKSFEEIRSDLLKIALEGEVGIWWILNDLRANYSTDVQITKKATYDIIHFMIENGTCIVESPHLNACQYVKWPEKNWEDIKARLNKSWIQHFNGVELYLPWIIKCD